MDDRRPYFVVVTSKSCKHCTIFREKVWPSLKNRLYRENRVHVVDIDLTSVDFPSNNSYPNDLKNWTRWFPTFLLFTGASWSGARKLEGVIFNGHMENGEAKLNDTKIPGTENNISSWINNQLNDNIIFKSNLPPFLAALKNESRPAPIPTALLPPVNQPKPVAKVAVNKGLIDNQRYKSRFF